MWIGSPHQAYRTCFSLGLKLLSDLHKEKTIPNKKRRTTNGRNKIPH
jgi:hypothetical protein